MLFKTIDLRRNTETIGVYDDFAALKSMFEACGEYIEDEREVLPSTIQYRCMVGDSPIEITFPEIGIFLLTHPDQYKFPWDLKKAEQWLIVELYGEYDEYSQYIT